MSENLWFADIRLISLNFWSINLIICFSSFCSQTRLLSCSYSFNFSVFSSRAISWHFSFYWITYLKSFWRMCLCFIRASTWVRSWWFSFWRASFNLATSINKDYDLSSSLLVYLMADTAAVTGFLSGFGVGGLFDVPMWQLSDLSLFLPTMLWFPSF